MANIVNPNLPADLPTDWTTEQYVSPNGSEVSLSQQHGYNYLMEQVNAAQTAVNTLAEQAQEAVSGLESGALTATATRSGTTVAITGPEDAVTVTFLAPADWTEGDSYTYNGTPITVTDLNGNPVTDGWKQGAVLTFQISGGVAYFVGSASGSFLPLSGGTMTGPAVGAPGGSTIPQFRNVYYGTEALTPGSSPLPEGTLYITPEMEYEGAGKRTCRFVVGTSTAGWTAADCDYLCDGTADDVEINAAIQALPETGGEIVIIDGTYNITSAITLGKNNVTITGNGASSILQRNWDNNGSLNDPKSALIFVPTAISGCTIQNIKIDGNSSLYKNSSNVAIGIFGDNNIVTNIFCFNDYRGILVYSGSNNIISNNTILFCTFGITLFNANSNGVSNNICDNSKYSGIYLISGSTRNTIHGNTCNSCVYGIGIFSSSNNVVTSNTCNDFSNIGINIMQSASDEIYCGNNLISGNSFIRGAGTPDDYIVSQHTIFVSNDAYKNLIIGNIILGKNYTEMSGETNNTWTNNKFE